MEWQCPVCTSSHSNKNRILLLSYPTGPLSFYHCSCGLHYNDYAVKGTIPQVYNDSYYSHARYTFELGQQEYVKHLVDFVERSLPMLSFQNNTIRHLDIGCATGDFVAWAVKQGWQTEGIDLSPSAVSKGRKRSLPLLNTALEALTENPSSYDIITLWDVLEHIPDTSKALKIIHNLLKEDGLLLIKTVTSISLVERLARFLYKISFGKIQGPIKRMYVRDHLYIYTEDLLRRYLLKEGWKVSLIEQSDTPPNALSTSFFMRLLLMLIFLFQKITKQSYEVFLVCRKNAC